MINKILRDNLITRKEEEMKIDFINNIKKFKIENISEETEYDNIISLVEQSSGLIEGEDFIRDDDGLIECLTEEAEKYFKR